MAIRDHVLTAMERATSRQSRSLAVLVYHRVGEPHPHLDPAHLSATPEQFEAHVRYLTSVHNLVGADALTTTRQGGTLPPRAVAITFDYGYREFATVAWPILRRFGIPVTLFVPTAYPGDPARAFWWERLHRLMATTGQPYVDVPFGRLPITTPATRAYAYRVIAAYLHTAPHARAMAMVEELAGQLGTVPARPEVLSWTELRALASEGLHIAPRARTHHLLDQLSRDEVAKEVEASRLDLERELGSCPPLFAHPAAELSPDLEKTLSGAGFQVAFGTGKGLNDLRSMNWLDLRRIPVQFEGSLAQLRTRLHPLLPTRLSA